MSRLLKTYKNKVSQIYKSGVHNGIDIIGDNGLKNGSGYLDYLLAHSDGIVVGCRNDITGYLAGSYGNYVKIKHDNGMFTLYAHIKCGTVKVKTGDRVSKGQVIGYMGNTGKSYGAHLHFEVRNTNDVKIDPTPYIDSDLPTSSKSKYPSNLLPKLPQRGYFWGTDTKKVIHDRGSEVGKLQKFLNWACGLNIKVDNALGPDTTSAIKTYQKMYGLKVDGNFGPACLAKAKTIEK